MFLWYYILEQNRTEQGITLAQYVTVTLKGIQFNQKNMGMVVYHDMNRKQEFLNERKTTKTLFHVTIYDIVLT